MGRFSYFDNIHLTDKLYPFVFSFHDIKLNLFPYINIMLDINIMSVPKIIHQLWIGPKSIPINAMNTIKQDNPDYDYILWNEEKLEELTIPKKYKQKIKLMEELNGKADMYRWIILEKYGGVFVDADMISIQPIDDFIINGGPFFCWENEIVRNGLCATTIMGFTKEHIIPKLAIQWIMNNRITSPAWISVGPQLLTNIYNSLPDKNVVNVLPSYTFLPDHHSGMKYKGHGKVYMTHEWGSTRNNYASINNMNIPTHHTEPKDILNITIPDDINTKKLKEMIQGIKNIQGHFGINLSTHLDISKYLNSTRFIYVNGNIPEERKRTLTDIMNHYGSDKGKGRHDYTKTYEELFEPMRDTIKTFCEIGLGTNNPNIKSSMGIHGKPLASIYGWKEYFESAEIYGGDIDARILKSGERFSTYHIDMTDKESIDKFWAGIEVKEYDIVLDDGLHEFEANKTLFENSYDKFKYYYIIEDVGTDYLDQWREQIEEWNTRFPHYDIELKLNPLPTNDYDNNLIIIKNRKNL